MKVKVTSLTYDGCKINHNNSFPLSEVGTLIDVGLNNEMNKLKLFQTQ